MPEKKYAIEFRYPECDTVYAGMYKGALGWAPTLKTAIIWADPEIAQGTLDNGYATAEFGHVIEVNPE